MEKFISLIIDLIDRNYHQKKINKLLINNKFDTVFDVGAHKGEFTINLIKNIKFSKIYMFEPQSEIFFKLKKKFFKSNKILLHNMALSNQRKKKKLKINIKTSTSTFSSYNKQSYWGKIKNFLLTGSNKTSFIKSEFVKTTTLDFFCKKNNIKNIDLLKIDTEGHELEILNGGKFILANKVKYLIIEFHSSNMYKNYSSMQIEKLLYSYNFRLIKKFKFPFLAFEDRVYKKY